MNNDTYALKIQFMFKLNNVKRKLIEFNKLGLNDFAQNNNFEQFSKIIIDKNIIQKTKNLCTSLISFKKDIIVIPRILLSAFIIKYYTNEIIGTEEHHPYDDNLIESSNHLINLLNNNDYNNLWICLKNYCVSFKLWSDLDKDRSIEKMIISYYFRCEHIDKINNEDFENNENKENMLNELENQKNEIIISIKMINKHFDINYLKQNYKLIYENIEKTREHVKQLLTDNMKKAYYNIICNDLLNGSMTSAFDLIKDIEKRCCSICPEKRLNSFQNKFADEQIMDLLLINDFSQELIIFINFIIDFIILMDSQINDTANLQWKSNLQQLLTNNYSTNFPKILLEIEQHIDSIIQQIMLINQQNS